MNINRIRNKRIRESKKKYRLLKKEKERKIKLEEKRDPIKKIKKYNFTNKDQLGFLEKERNTLEKEYDEIRQKIKSIDRKHYINRKNSNIEQRFFLQKECQRIDELIERISKRINILLRETHQL